MHEQNSSDGVSEQQATVREPVPAIDLEKLADKVYELLRADIRMDRTRGLSPKTFGGQANGRRRQ